MRRGREGEEVRNEMGGQTWVNLASGGHTLPEETGALRLASTLIAFTYSHTNALSLTHKDTHTLTHTHMHTCCKPVLQNSYTTGTRN